jgi:hypothetical protein
MTTTTATATKKPTRLSHHTTGVSMEYMDLKVIPYNRERWGVHRVPCMTPATDGHSRQLVASPDIRACIPRTECPL